MKRTPIKRQNRARKARPIDAASEDYKAYVRTLPCTVCRKPAPSEAHHVKSRGAGGVEVKNLLPLCLEHHNFWHTMGRKTFARIFNINPGPVAIALWVEWREAP